MSKRKERDDDARKSDKLFPFQQHIVEQAVAKKCVAVFADTGLGKTRILLWWLELVLRDQPGAMGLVVTPLSTGRQIVSEALGMALHAVVEKRVYMPRPEDLV